MIVQKCKLWTNYVIYNNYFYFFNIKLQSKPLAPSLLLNPHYLYLPPRLSQLKTSIYFGW